MQSRNRHDLWDFSERFFSGAIFEFVKDDTFDSSNVDIVRDFECCGEGENV